MNYHGRAKVNARRPQAFAICDRCSGTVQHVDLQWQFQYAGTSLINLRLLVCRRCYDTPQPQLKSRLIPPDPVPIMNPRPLNTSVEEGESFDSSFSTDFGGGE